MAKENGSSGVQRYLRARSLRRLLEAGRNEVSHASAPLAVPPIRPEQRVPPDRAHEAIDLLNDQPATVIDAERIGWALAFGFAGGDIGGVLLESMRRAPVAESDWDAKCFVDGLFIEDLLKVCMRVQIGSLVPLLDTTFLARVITHPPKDRATVEHRRAILRELSASPKLKDKLSELYVSLYELRARLDVLDPESGSRAIDTIRRRLEVLASLRDALDRMGSDFAECTSGLSRIHRFATHARSTPGYGYLVDLLDYDNHRASVGLQVRIGSDGRIRHFAITQVTENRGNRFYRTPVGRFLFRIGLLLRGFSLGEPEIANHWIDAAFKDMQHVIPPMLQLLGELEVYLAMLELERTATARGLAVSLPELLEPSEVTGDSALAAQLGYAQLWNPLLFAHDSPITACDLHGVLRATTLVTGPNSGGKTRLLQAVAIAQMLAQSGFFVPAARASLERASGLFVSLIEEARADQKEGRLGTELGRIRELFERARPGSLIVLDELCSGTNPSEGEDIIRLVLSLLGELDASVFITTHFLQFATRLSEEPGRDSRLRFLQAELDANERPTYRFVPGVAQTSLAHRTAARLGVTREALLALIEKSRAAR